MQPVFSQQAKQRLASIHQLSKEINGDRDHLQKLLEMVRHHVDEIEALFVQNDPHAVIETGDLLVLCMEVLAEKNVDADDVVNTAFARFEKKLNGIVEASGRSPVQD